jgi:hypothetical protein
MVSRFARPWALKTVPPRAASQRVLLAAPRSRKRQSQALLRTLFVPEYRSFHLAQKHLSDCFFPRKFPPD